MTPQDEGLGDLFSQLIDDGKALARAELQLARQLALGRIKRAGLGIGLGFGALVLLQAAVTALLVGFVLALAPATGPLIATLVVFAGALVAIVGLGLAAKGSIAAAFSGEEDKAG